MAVNLLSVVIIGRNEGERLPRCLNSVWRMDRPCQLEVIYVDSGSVDRSVSVATEMGAQVLVSRRNSAASGRNAGWQAAHAAWILFLDGDTILHPEFARIALDAVTGGDIAVVWGHRREIRPHLNAYHRVLDLDWVYPPGISEFCGGDALMRRAALEEAGGFDETLIAGEEPELCSRLRGRGYKILHIDAPMTGHDLAITRFSQYWRRAVRAGYAYSNMARRTRNGPQPLWQRDSRNNVIRALVLLSLPPAALAASFLLRSILPAALAVLFLALICLRSAWKSRWKSKDTLTLLLYGIHSHLQQIPIFIGQLTFWNDVRTSRGRGIIEYK